MANYQDKAPGVYIEEITPAGPIAGVSTSVVAFVGLASGPAEPTKVTNWTQFEKAYGRYADNADSVLHAAVRGFYDNGGTVAYIVLAGSLALEVPKDAAPVEQGQKLVPVKAAETNLAGGVNPTQATNYADALEKLKKHDEISLVCAPGADLAIQEKVLNHCKDKEVSDRFAIMDSPEDAAPNVDIASVNDDNGWGAIYYPWIGVAHPTEKDASGRPATVFVPPSGHIAGIYARSDNQRGVHKAPANEIIEGALKVKTVLTDTEQGILNKKGVNCIRVFPGDRPRVWGARTTSTKTAWRYINVRRLFLYVEESIQEGIRWAIFEPNDTLLWKKLERTITEFLTRVWRSGALFGRTAKEAFYVKIDEELNPPDVRDLGQVNIEVGIAPVRPAEFIVVRIGMWEGGARITEL